MRDTSATATVATIPGFVRARSLRVNLRQLDRKYLGRESPAQDVQVARTKGAFVYDARGRRYIDFLSGWCVGNFGWDNTAIKQSPARRRPDYVYPEYLYQPWVELAQLLAEITPGQLEKTYRATGGSEAVDIALQLAMASTGRRKFVSIEGSYHGNTIGTVSVASSEEREPYPNLLPSCVTISPPLGDRGDRAAGDASEKARRRGAHHGADQLQPRRADSRGRVHEARAATLPPLRNAVHRR